MHLRHKTLLWISPLLAVALAVAGFALMTPPAEAQSQARPSCNFVELSGTESTECLHQWARSWVEQPGFSAATDGSQKKLTVSMVYDIPIGRSVISGSVLTKAQVGFQYLEQGTAGSNTAQDPPPIRITRAPTALPQAGRP